MPKLPTDYSKTCIYKIVCKDINITDCYVGHTTDFRKRKNRHKNNTIKKTQLKVYTNINDNGGWDNWEMIEIEKFPCKDANEAKSRERYWYELLNSTMNTLSPMTTPEERVIQQKETHKIYFEKNKDLIRQKDNDRYERDKEKRIACVMTAYYKNHETNKEYKLQKYQEEKGFLAEKILCECGVSCNRSSLNQHKKTLKHQKYLTSKIVGI
jgi:hypothetical protein